MKCIAVVYGLMALFVPVTMLPAKAQSRGANEQPSPLLSVDSAFVWVPALVKTEKGKTLDALDVNRFHLLDNGAPEKVTQINTDGLPVSLVILMQTGGSASQFLPIYTKSADLIVGLAGRSVHEISLVTFDSRIEEIWHFPARTDGVNYALTHQSSGDKGAAIKDAVAFGVRQLQGEPGRFRRIVLLLSQGTDNASSTSSQSLVEQLGTASTVVYSLTFPGENTHAVSAHENRNTGSAGDALEKTCLAIDDQTAEEVTYLTGGIDFQFDDQRSFYSAMLEAISDVHDQITFGFQPRLHEVGFHSIELQVDSPKLQVTARRAYWRAPPK